MIHGDGPIPSRVMIVGEFPDAEDERVGRPFSARGSGQELNRLLGEAGIMRSECFCTYVCRVRPRDNRLEAFVAMTKKDITAAHTLMGDKWVTAAIRDGYAHLLREIEMVKPNLIIALDNLALWALTGAWGVAKWRGSLLTMQGIDNPLKVIPTHHPKSVLRSFDLRALVLNDLKRAKRHMTSRTYEIPKWSFITRPTFTQVIDCINALIARLDAGEELWIEFDLETSVATKHIRCIGISWSAAEAISIPLTCSSNKEGYWSLDEEAFIVFLLQKLLCHRRVKVRGQNLLFDCQYTYRYWHFIPNVAQDTMISQHSCFSALPKSLDFLSSMYCEFHKQWKLISWKGC